MPDDGNATVVQQQNCQDHVNREPHVNRQPHVNREPHDDQKKSLSSKPKQEPEHASQNNPEAYERNPEYPASVNN
jgi:hypothetical protein